jgi:hypothetical protein
MTQDYPPIASIPSKCVCPDAQDCPFCQYVCDRCEDARIFYYERNEKFEAESE